jgi:hypothetical protein
VLSNESSAPGVAIAVPVAWAATPMAEDGPTTSVTQQERIAKATHRATRDCVAVVMA